LEIDKIITSVTDELPEDPADIQANMENAYQQYKLGNFSKSYVLFERIANQAWTSGKYISYFIAKHNVKSSRNLIRGFFTNIEEDKKKGIIRDIDGIDLDKLLFDIPYMGDKEYELLKMIRDDNVLHKASREIDDAYKNIVEMYEGHKDRSMRVFGPYYPQTIELELKKIRHFYTGNYIISDEFTDFIRVVKKGIEALLISYATSDNYNNKLRAFSTLFFDMAISYCDTNELRKLTEKYEINTLTFDDKSLADVLAASNNFFTSFFKRINVLGETFNPNQDVVSQLTNVFIKSKFRKVTANIFLILSGIKIEKDKAGSIINNSLRFLEAQEFLSWNSSRYIAAFLHRNYHLFTENDFKLLIGIIAEKKKYIDGGKLLQAAALIKDKANLIGIADIKVLNGLLSTERLKELDQAPSVDIWTIAADDLKGDIQKTIIGMLDRSFDSSLYVTAVNRGVVDLDDYLEAYIADINAKKAKMPLASNDMTGSFEFTNAMIFLYGNNISSNDKRLKAFTNLDPSMQFFLFPEKFDYSKFNIEWLWILGEREDFYKRFKKIPAFKKAVKQALKNNFDAELVNIYFKFFL
jgi:hypothetical protein